MASTNEMKGVVPVEPDDRTAEQHAYAAISAVQREADQRVAEARANEQIAWKSRENCAAELISLHHSVESVMDKMQQDLNALIALRNELNIQIEDQTRTLTLLSRSL